MNPNNHELDKQRVFDAFCKKVLKNVARNCYGEMKRLRDKEVSFSELSAHELEQLSTTDEYFQTERIFNELSDGEIGKKLDMIRSPVQNRRKNTLRELRKMLEEEKANE